MSEDLSLDWGGMRVSSRIAEHHFAVVGATGSGKTITIKRLLRSVFERSSRPRALIFDAKTDILSQLPAYGISAKDVRIFHPFDRRAYAWDIAVDLQAPQDLDEAAKLLFPPASDQSKDAFFEQAPASLARAVLLSFYLKWPTDLIGRLWTLRDLIHALSAPSRLVAILEWAHEQNLGAIENYFAPRKTGFVNPDVLATIENKVTPYRVIAAYWHKAAKEGRSLSLDAWRRDHSVLLIGHSHHAGAAVDAINRVLFQRAFDLLLDFGTESDESWVVLDEVGSAKRIDKLSMLLFKGRTKGVRIVLGFQDITTLRTHYGQEADAMVGQAGNMAVFFLQSRPTADWAEQVFGHQEQIIQLRTEGHTHGKEDTWSESWAEQLHTSPIFMASQFQNLKAINLQSKQGLAGFYATKGVANFEHEIPIHELAKDFRLSEQGSGLADFEPVDPKDGLLEPWTEEELRALGLAATSTFAPPAQSPTPSGPSPDEPLDYR